MPQDQQSIVIDQFRGLYDRGELLDTNVTQIENGFFKTLDNFYCLGDSVCSRPGTLRSGDIPNAVDGKLLRLYPRASPSTGYYFLQSRLGNREIRLTGTILYTLTANTNDFQLFVVRNIAYGGEIALDGTFGQPLGTGNLQIHKSGTAAMRAAAGVAPSAGVPMAAATSATAGVVEAGLHLIAVAYESNTGFITPPGVFVATVYTPTQYTAPGGFKIDLTNIPVPADPVAFPFKHILASRIIRPPFNGDVLVPELFFIPPRGAQSFRIPAATVSLTGASGVDFYDTSLVESADYLLDELDAIPSGTCYCIYSNRLVIVGFPPTATAPTVGGLDKTPSYVVRVSNPGTYESFSAIEGWIQVAVDDGDALQACWEQNGNLYITKSNRTYSTRDNGGPPNTWPVDLIDAAIGCGPWGVAKLDSSQNTLIEGGAIIGSRRGIYFFTGQYSDVPLTYNIEAIYRRVATVTSFATFLDSKFYYDSYRKLLYCLPNPSLDTGSGPGSTFLFVGSCDNGLNPQSIRWNKFNAFGINDATITDRRILDIYTVTAQPGTLSSVYSTFDTMLAMIFNDGTSASRSRSANNMEVYFLNTELAIDDSYGLSDGARLTWQLVGYPANIEELDKLQATVVRMLIKHNNNQDPIDFNLGVFDYTYNEFSPTVPQFFGDQALTNMVLLPQLYDAPINARSKLLGIAMRNGIRGGELASGSIAVPITINNTIFIQRMVLIGNKVSEEKLRGSIR